jgi:hypothetical protein
MANIAISALPVAASQAGADVLPIVQATTSTTKQLSVTNLFTSPTFVTPALGTVASGVISACTSTGMVLATPTLTAPVLGTVASGNISACTSTSMVLTTPVRQPAPALLRPARLYLPALRVWATQRVLVGR